MPQEKLQQEGGIVTAPHIQLKPCRGALADGCHKTASFPVCDRFLW